jgi:hypothetical protein
VSRSGLDFIPLHLSDTITFLGVNGMEFSAAEAEVYRVYLPRRMAAGPKKRSLCRRMRSGHAVMRRND